MTTPGPQSCTILLDDAYSQASDPTSRLYQSPLKSIQATNANELDISLHQIEAAIHEGRYVVACFSYELGEFLLGLIPKPSSTPWVQAWIFDSVKKMSSEESTAWIQQQTLDSIKATEPVKATAITHLTSSIDFSKYESDIESIHGLIESGDTYQVNHTYRLKGQLTGHPLKAYQILRSKQPGAFGAYIEHPNGWILSCSPEWFLQKDGDTLVTKPMKGTAKLGESSLAELKSDSKNRAENVMIVDLLRNDLGKVSVPGSIQVPELFEVTQHGNVLQMTSTIRSQTQENLRLKGLLEAIFPCGSVTGAPKKRTMQIIQNLETEPRNLYCGAIAWFDPSHHAGLGNLGMSVVIRTLEVASNQSFQMGVGGGITIDSQAQDEWHECQTKSDFLKSLIPQTESIGLFETIRIQNQQATHLDRHLLRLKKSADYLNISANILSIEEMIAQECSKLDDQKVYRMRVDLSAQGQVSIKVAMINALKASYPLLWAKDILPGHLNTSSLDSLLQHKVTRRTIYDQAWTVAEQLGSFDALFINEQGFVTEGGRSNIFIKKEGQWLTPPISAGCLPGVMRQIVIDDPHYSVIEANITPEDVVQAEEIIYTNALRGVIAIQN